MCLTKHYKKHTTFLFLILLSTTFSCRQPSNKLSQNVNINESLALLLKEEDTDNDKKITIDDKGDKQVTLTTVDGTPIVVTGVYPLANLLQELKIAEREMVGTYWFDSSRVFENPVERISRLIKTQYWDNLTRRISVDNLRKVIEDEKQQGDKFYLYVPYEDTLAWSYYSQNKDPKVQVVHLPEKITPEYLEGLEGKHGLLSLKVELQSDGRIEPVPYVVPGGRFNEMYGWDSYFEALGLLEDGRTDLAKAMVDQFVYELDHYGKILNANRTYYLTRSQPPFLTSMALAVYERLPKNAANKAWLKAVMGAAIKEYNTVWMNESHLTPTGLSRYFGTGTGYPPEVEPGHFNAILKPFATKHHMTVGEFEMAYRSGTISTPALDNFFSHDRCVRESGHDTSYRWYEDSTEHCADFVTVDLNCLLYKYEIDMARTIKKEFGGQLETPYGTFTPEDWYQKSGRRKILIMKYLWNDEKQLFYDYNYVAQQQSDYLTATVFYPLWACHPDDPSTYLMSNTKADQLIANALEKLEAPGGLLASSKASRDQWPADWPERQWDYPNGWAPHQMIAWEGLMHYEHEEDAQRLIYKWLSMITENARDYNGTIPEKFDVINRSHAVFAEYGNVGTDFQYITKEGFGWMNASYQVGLGLLDEEKLKKLKK